MKTRLNLLFLNCDKNLVYNEFAWSKLFRKILKNFRFNNLFIFLKQRGQVKLSIISFFICIVIVHFFNGCNEKIVTPHCFDNIIRKVVGDNFDAYDYIYATNIDWCPSCIMEIVESFNNSNCKSVLGVFFTQFKSKKATLESLIKTSKAVTILIKKENNNVATCNLLEPKLYKINKNITFKEIESKQIIQLLNKCH